MKVIMNIPPRQIQKVLLLSGLKDEDVDKINEVLPKYDEIDITDYVEKNDDDNYARLAFASFAMGAIAEQEDVNTH